MKKQLKKKQKRLGLLITLLILTTLLISCKTIPKINNTPPSPIDENGEPLVIFNEETGMVSMTLEYWIQLTEYIIAEEEIKKQY